MKYTRYEIGPYNLHIINTDKFKRNVITVNFKRKVKKSETTLRNMLANILVKSTKKYQTEREMIIETENLYNIGYSGGTSISGNYSILYYEMTFLNEKYTEDKMSEKTLQFLADILFNPNSTNNKFNEKLFNLAQKEIKSNIENFKESPEKLATILLYENMDKKASYSYLADGYLEDLEKINASNLYQYYKSVLQSDIVDIFIIGNIEPERIKQVMGTNFLINTIKKPATSHYLMHTKFRKRVKTVKVTRKINQSILKIGFKLDNLSDFERKYVINIYNYIIGGGPDSKLFQTIREKNSLCYHISSKINKVFNVMTITAGINAINFKKTVTLIKKEIKNMQKGDFKEEIIDAAKKVYTSSILSMLDSPYNVIGIYEGKEYFNTDLVETRIEEINKVTKQMIIEVSKKIKMDTIFLLEGENNE